MSEPPATSPLTRRSLLVGPDYRMVSVHGGSGHIHGDHEVITRSTTDGVAADAHWIVFQCGNTTVKVGFDITVWQTGPPPADGENFDQEHLFTVRFPEGELVVDQGTRGVAAMISLPHKGTWLVRVRSRNHRAVMREAARIEQQACDEDWDLDREGEVLARLDGKERYALDLWPAL
ncbi:hypothetical protein J0910_30925 [Nocardiopsis sp. CNT-189]|uniref:hypothetical protein n=1 Tax=Nocardiopsis oceanisediminis TaxID=2816862 RepID=UPI003B362857